MNQKIIKKLKKIVKKNKISIMPCCYDALSAKLIEKAGFELSFMSGFAVSASKIGMPDTGLISYGEMVDQGRQICSAVNIPIIGDGDTGYGNEMNVKRTVKGYGDAGFASIMIEDQLSPKQCGHTKGKTVVAVDEACSRIKAAIDARSSANDILIMARTDARYKHGIDEAIERALLFEELGADIIFIEAPETKEEMVKICNKITKPKVINLVEGGSTPMLTPTELESIGFNIIAYPLTLLSSSIKSMQNSLNSIKEGIHPFKDILPFEELQSTLGFDEYFKEEKLYKLQKYI